MGTFPKEDPMTKTLFARAALVAALFAPALVSANPTGDKPAPTAPATKDKAAEKLSDADLHVLTDVHATNQMEIEAGKLAKTKGGTPAIKKFGQELITDHTKADKNALALAKARGVTLADHPTPRDDAEKAQMEKDMAAMERLKTLDGAAFDSEFLAVMLDGHTRTVAKLDAAIGTVSDAKLKALLTKIKPVVQKHADRAKALQSAPPAAAAK
jgi:putative membrane protein